MIRDSFCRQNNYCYFPSIRYSILVCLLHSSRMERADLTVVAVRSEQWLSLVLGFDDGNVVLRDGA
jgi:hypothetical protein